MTRRITPQAVYIAAAAMARRWKSPDDGVFWRAPDYIAGQLDRHGKFDVEVTAGDYYLTIIKRVSGKIWGPLQEGDIYYLQSVAVGEKKMLTIMAGRETDLDRLEGKRFAGRGVAGYSEYVEIAAISGTLTGGWHYWKLPGDLPILRLMECPNYCLKEG